MRDLIAAGVDVFRLNFSHGTHEARAASAEAGRLVAILQDLSGPKIRTGLLKGGGIDLAVGEYSVAVVRTLDAVIRDAESHPSAMSALLSDVHVLSGHGRALCEAAVTLADHGVADGIVAITHGGKTARLLSALRPRAPIFGATDQHDIAHRLALSSGVMPVVTDLRGDVETVAVRIGRQLAERGQVPAGGVFAVVSINPDLEKGRTNFLKLQRL